eukprot:7193943-Pyramimonas_sp.AAC.1
MGPIRVQRGEGQRRAAKSCRHCVLSSGHPLLAGGAPAGERIQGAAGARGLRGQPGSRGYGHARARRALGGGHRPLGGGH